VTGKKTQLWQNNHNDDNIDKPQHTRLSGWFIYLWFINNAVSSTIYTVSNGRL